MADVKQQGRRAALQNLHLLKSCVPLVNAGQMKMFAALVMLIDHMAYALLERNYTADGLPVYKSIQYGVLLDDLGRTVGRQAFPVFCYFLVEGFFHTRSRPKYFARLSCFAVVSQVPFHKALFPRTHTLHANVFVTLGFGFLAIWILDWLGRVLLPAVVSPVKNRSGEYAEGKNKVKISGSIWGCVGNVLDLLCFVCACGGVVFGFCLLAEIFHSDYSYGGVAAIVIMYLLHKHRGLSLSVSWIWLSLYNSLELWTAPAFLLLACYDGQRGRQHKYFFYLFYPAHLLALWLIRRYLFVM